MNEDSIIAKLEKLRKNFFAALPVRLENIRNLLEHIEPEAKQAESIQELCRQIHSLAGTAGTYGLAGVESAMRHMEHVLNERPESAALGYDCRTALLSILDGIVTQESHDFSIAGITELAQGQNLRKSGYANIALIGKSAHVYSPVFKYTDMDAQCFDSIKHAITHPSIRRPCLAIIGTDNIEMLNGDDASFFAGVVVVGPRHFESELAAASLGARRYLEEPVSDSQLIDAVCALSPNYDAKPYRVLIVDDDELLTNYYRVLFEQSGFEVSIVNDPRDVLERLDSFEPEVLLMDLYMPEIPGSLTASLIRQNPKYDHVAILFVSSESQLELQRAAIEAGGADDFIEKPVNPQRLILVTRAKAKRSRQIARTAERMSRLVSELTQQQQALDAHAIVSITDAKGDINYVNDMFCRISGYNTNELMGQNHRIVKSSKHSDEYYKEMWDTISAGNIWQGEFCNLTKNGSEYWVASSIIPFLDASGLPYQYVSIRTDITQQKQNEHRIRARQERTSQHHQALMSIARAEVDAHESLHAELCNIVEHAAKALEADCASIWLIDWSSNTLVNNCQWRDGAFMQYESNSLPQGEYLEIVNLLEKHRQISTSDIKTDAVFSKIINKYLMPDSANAAIMTPIRTNNCVSGLMMVADRSREREWFYEDGQFLASLADMAMLAIERDSRYQIQQKLTASEELLRRSQDAANIGTWDWDIGNDRIMFSDRIPSLYNIDDHHALSASALLVKAIYADDQSELEAAFMACRDGSDYLDITYRVVFDNEDIHWLQSRGKVVDHNGARHVIGITQDVTKQQLLEQELDERNCILATLRSSLQQYIGTARIAEVAERLLSTLLETTKSEYGFVGEVLYDESDAPYIRMHAITNIAWNEDTRHFYQESSPDGIEFRNLDTLFGPVLTTGQPVIANDAPNDPRAGGVPEGHPPLNQFLGMPIYYGNKLVGIFGLANCKTGYNEGLIEELEPFSATYSAIIHSYRALLKEERIVRELKEAKALAERANRAKSEFLSHMSHELRTPLNAILGFAQVLSADIDDPLSENQEDSVNEISRAGTHLLSLINEILDIARIEAGRVEISVEPIELSRLIEDCHALTAPLVAEKELDFVLDIDTEERLYVMADHTRLKQIVLNLLSNAIKYNRPHGMLSLSVKPWGEKHVRIMVSDTGIGISLIKQKEMFQPFNRLGTDTKGIEGAGIGLSITKRLVELMEGDLDYESKESEGSRFWVDLPRANIVAGAELHDEAYSRYEESYSGNDSMASKSSTVLYIEDNPANLKLVTQLIDRQNGRHILTAPDGVLGLELARSHKPDLILLDINLPGMNGYEILESLRSNPVTQSIPVVAISANAMAKDIERGLNAGFEKYITKPIDIPKFLFTLDELLQDSEVLEQRSGVRQ